MKRSSRILGLCAALAVAMPAMAFELAHDGGAVKLEQPPAKIASFDLAVLDSLNVLGVDVAGVPKSTYTGKLAKFNDATQVGTLFEPDYDALKKLAPDLIFAGGRSQKAVPELNKIAPTATLNGKPTAFLESFRKNNLALAQAFQKDDAAQHALHAIDEDVKALHALNQNKTGLFLFIINGNVMAHVPGDRFGYAYELAGLKSVLPAKAADAPAAERPEPGSEAAKAAASARAETLKTAAKAEPDWLIVLDRGAINGGEKTAADTLAKHPDLSQTQAYKQGRVFYVDPNGWYVVGGGLANLKAITTDMLAAMKK